MIPSNIIDLNPILKAARQKEVAERYQKKLAEQPGALPANVQKAIDETRNVKVDGAPDR